MSFRFLVVGALALAVIPLCETEARACGGCFTRPQEVTVVSGHRMVFSISQSQSILWDQFSYAGDPSEFAWVLPVHAASVKVELAHDEFISALDAYSTPTIIGPSQNNNGGSFGCGASASAYDGADAGTGVHVISQEVVGPYEVATLASTDPQALETWLSNHGYSVPQSVQPTVAAYVNEGFDFIALRLLPGKGVAAMQPVRVVSKGADPTLPLRMVAAGVGTDVGIVLFVISEGRYEAANFDNVQVDLSKLEWNKALAKSNFDDLTKEALTRGDGRNWVLDFAGHLNTSDFGRGQFSFTYQSASLTSKCSYGQVHGPDFPNNYYDAGSLFGDASTSDASDDDANTDASDDAGDDAAVTDAGPVSDAGDDGGSSSYDSCYFDDFTTATAGMAKSDVVLTRLHADLKTSALDQDLHLKAAADQTLYDNFHNAAQSADGCNTSSSAPDSSLVIVSLGGLAALLWQRRRAR